MYNIKTHHIPGDKDHAPGEYFFIHEEGTGEYFGYCYVSESAAELVKRRLTDRYTRFPRSRADSAANFVTDFNNCLISDYGQPEEALMIVEAQHEQGVEQEEPEVTDEIRQAVIEAAQQGRKDFDEAQRDRAEEVKEAIRDQTDSEENGDNDNGGDEEHRQAS